MTKQNCIVPTKLETEDTNYRPADRRSFFTRQGSMLLGAYSTGELWNPTDLYKIDMPEPLKSKQKEKAVKQAMKLLIAEGLIEGPKLAS